MQNSVDSYNLTLLSAVQDVNDAMASYTSSLRAIDSYSKVVDDAREAFTLAFDLYRDGLSDFTDVADAQISLLQYADRLVTARATRLLLSSRSIALSEADGTSIQLTIINNPHQ